MASSSTSSTPKSFKYDVFLSFRGEDTRKNFVDHLYSALEQKGIYTYKYDERIKKGKMVNDELIKAIKDSKFYIIVFSKNYASSSWCLGELVEIMECHKTGEHTAYPVFYDVEPTQVRKQSGAVGEAFAKHEKEEAAGKWRRALEEAAGLAGWELKDTANGHEAKFIQKIIEEISPQLHSMSFSSDEKLVGLETRVNDVISSLEIGIDDVRMIGIKGMGGAGKTTLARAVFDQISYLFEGNSFADNVREVSSASLSGLKSLQCQVLSDVLNDNNINIRSVHEGKIMMKRRMRDRKVLIVLDDVNHINQLEALAGERNWFKSGSRIIITTRDEKVLLAHRGTLIFDVKLLSDEEAICLFSRYVFGTDIPIPSYQELSKRVVRYAAGLPLTISVLGSFLCGEDKPEWEDALKRLKTIPLTETLKILELSYTALEDDYKEMFLDVACIMKGWKKDIAIKALESCGFCAKIGLRVLQQKSLVTIYEDRFHNEYVRMHDSIEEMGRNIVRRSHPDTPHKHSRLWKNDEIEHILANDLGTEETRCIKFYSQNLDPYILIKGLGKMKALRFLSMVMENYSKNPEPDKFCLSFSEALGYMCLDGYPFRSLPITFQASNLVTLKLYHSNIVQLWEGGERKVLKKLKFLEISHLKLRTLDLVLAPNLETLSLQACHDLVEFSDAFCMSQHLKSLALNGCLLLEKLPESLGQLRSLEELSFSYTNIKHLPTSIRMLKHLKYLGLAGCSLLEELPDDIGQLECLERLDLSSTNIKYLPDGICMLKHLKYFTLKECSLLKELPKDLGQLECLERLDLSSTKMNYLPNGICMLKRLHFLGLSNVVLKKLPEDFGRLECLQSLELSCTTIEHFPHSILFSKHLNDLKLTDCPMLEKLPEDLSRLGCLKSLYISNAKIKHLPDSICMLKQLQYLYLLDCSLLEKLPEDLGQLRCLKVLNLSSAKIKHLPDSIAMLKNLTALYLKCFLSLEKLPEDLGRLESLLVLYLTNGKIRHLPDSICNLKRLKVLYLDHCLLLEQLPKDIGGLKCLKELTLSYSKIRHLPDSICTLKHVNSLNLNHCSLLQKLPEDICQLKSLKRLFIEGTCISHLPQSILFKGLHIYWSRELLETGGFTSQIQTDEKEGEICCFVVL